MANMKAVENVDAYIAGHPEHVQAMLNKMRKAITSVAKDAEEAISYGMPGYKYKGPLCYFGAHTHHCGFYPGDSKTIAEKFSEELKDYDVSKGTIRFPFDKPIPVNLVKAIVKERMKGNEANALAKALAKKAGKAPGTVAKKK